MKKKLSDKLKNKLQSTKYKARIGKSCFDIYNLVLALGIAFLISACTNKHEDHAETYTCPMHPTVISNKPGSCPVCGMNLVLKSSANNQTSSTDDVADLKDLLDSPNRSVLSSIKTIKGQYKSLHDSIEAQGVVTYDPRNIYTIPTRVGGRLEKIYLNYAFQKVKKGQKIAEIYSPELLAAQRELVFLLNNDPENRTLINASKNKLELLGLSSQQIQSLVEDKSISNTISIYSPYNGYVIANTQPPSALATSSTSTSNANEMGSGMGDKPSTTQDESFSESNSNGSTIKEGNYVLAGQTLFSIVDTDALRIELNLPVSKSGTIKKGDQLSLNYKNGNEEEAEVDFVQPFFDKDQDFIKLRVNTKNIKDLHIGHLVDAKISVLSIESLWVPREAVLDIGNNKIVFIKDGKTFKPKKVNIGTRSKGIIEIKSGLASIDEIAANAQYLVDSESFVKIRD
jgi:membrane fusion protein, copper/silver efflux system